MEMSVLTSKRVKNRVLLSVVTYEISSPRLCRVLCMILFFPFSFLYLIPFFIFFPVGEQIEMQVLEHNEIPGVEAPEVPAPQPGQLINIGVLILTIKPKLTLQSNSLGRYV